ncbi:hypothetical protein BG261_02870 [Floricoccus tropicus]|uniref:Replication-associated protein ORF2/G2P domain-containing protein n=1 Tax=Floricoccus tropicus TaxID=1859473 RepID=A0A1E8GPX0_9LACT|nr:hypothetical protein [Floricoccus tropicus]OFI49538.1 hypothetical protein BG261_02870 [Floricoccus tropicus]
MFMRNVTRLAGDNYKESVILGKDQKVDFVRDGKPRKRKEDISRPVQRNLNYRNAQTWFRLNAITNFSNGDLFGTLTYDDDFLPETIEDAEKELRLFIKRVNRARAKRNIEPVKYMAVIEGRYEKRLHHHFIMDNKLSRDEIESLWCKGRGKNKLSLGIANVRRISKQRVYGKYVPGIEVIAAYLTKEFKQENRKGKRKWFASKGNMKKPVTARTQNFKYTRSMIDKWIANDEVVEQLEKNNQDWELIEFERVNPETNQKELVKYDYRYDEFRGPRLYYRMRRRI